MKDGRITTFTTAAVEELLSLRNWVLLVLAITLVSGSTIWEHNLSSATAAAAPEGFSLADPRIWTHVLREFGFACFIALMISIFVERASRRKQEEAATSMQSRIAEDVVSGVFLRELPRPLVDAVLNQTLKARIIRTNHTASYVLQEPVPAIEDGGRQFLELEMTSDYTLRNVSHESTEVPIRIGFPVPPLKSLRQYVRLYSIRIGDEQLTEKQICEGDRGAQDTPNTIRYMWKRTIESKGTLRVVATYTIIKERSDSEIWRSLYPSLGMELNVNVHAKDIECGAHALSENEVERLTPIDSKSSHKWTLLSPLLPHQAIVLWWRPKDPGKPD